MTTKPDNFESHFRTVVQNLGGELLPEGQAETADFFFAKEKIVVEFKALTEEAVQEHAEKLEALVNDWRKRGLFVVFGQRVISLQKLNPTLQREWLNLLQAPVQRIIQKANHQIRSTKESLADQDAKGLLVIANHRNLLHTSPVDYMTLVARVLQKKRTGKPQFPHISGVIYFSLQIGSRDEGLPFWVQGQAERNDPEIIAFQNKLKDGWYAHVEQMTGRSVTEFLKSIQ
jgi:hypothetical protein